MNIEATAQDFASWIGQVLRVKFEEKEGSWIFHFKRLNKEKLLKVGEIEAILERLSEKDEIEDTAIYDSYSYEVLVKVESPFRYHLLSKDFVLRDEDNGITYTLSRPSNEYLLFLLYKVSRIAQLGHLSVFIPGTRQRLERNDEDKTILEVLKLASSLFRTLRVESEQNRTVNEFIKYANSFFFQLSYNLDSAFVPRRYFDELLRPVRIKRDRRTPVDELEAPKRFYIPDLVYHYQLAVASDNPSLEYLSYYHVAEHFFEAVFDDDLIERVRHTITQPDFSYKRKKDIKRLISKISKSRKYQGERVIFSEQEALRLTLERYVDIAVLLEKVKAYDDALVEYYKTSHVPFSGGDRVDLEDSDTSRVLKAVASRIYKTRNSIVHSKDSDRGKYVPFEHDKVLAREVPLLRFIAELIIIESSTLIS